MNRTSWNSNCGRDTPNTESGPRSDSRHCVEGVESDRITPPRAFDAVEMQRLPVYKAFHEACFLGSRWQVPSMQKHRVQTCCEDDLARSRWRFALRLVARFIVCRRGAGISSGLARMIAAMRSLNSSTVSTWRCCFIWVCDEFVMKFLQTSVLPMATRTGVEEVTSRL